MKLGLKELIIEIPSEESIKLSQHDLLPLFVIGFIVMLPIFLLTFFPYYPDPSLSLVSLMIMILYISFFGVPVILERILPTIKNEKIF